MIIILTWKEGGGDSETGLNPMHWIKEPNYFTLR